MVSDKQTHCYGYNEVGPFTSLGSLQVIVIQWNLSYMDTLGTKITVLISEVSWTKSSVLINEVSLFQRCPLREVPL